MCVVRTQDKTRIVRPVAAWGMTSGLQPNKGFQLRIHEPTLNVFGSCSSHYLKGVHDVPRLLPLFQPRLDEADPLRAIIGGNVQDTGTAHRRRCSVLKIPDLEDHAHVRLPTFGFR